MRCVVVCLCFVLVLSAGLGSLLSVQCLVNYGGNVTRVGLTATKKPLPLSLAHQPNTALTTIEHTAVADPTVRSLVSIPFTVVGIQFHRYG